MKLSKITDLNTLNIELGRANPDLKMGRIGGRYIVFKKNATEDKSDSIKNGVSINAVIGQMEKICKLHKKGESLSVEDQNAIREICAKLKTLNNTLKITSFKQLWNLFSGDPKKKLLQENNTSNVQSHIAKLNQYAIKSPKPKGEPSKNSSSKKNQPSKGKDEPLNPTQSPQSTTAQTSSIVEPSQDNTQNTAQPPKDEPQNHSKGDSKGDSKRSSTSDAAPFNPPQPLLTDSQPILPIIEDSVDSSAAPLPVQGVGETGNIEQKSDVPEANGNSQQNKADNQTEVSIELQSNESSKEKEAVDEKSLREKLEADVKFLGTCYQDDYLLENKANSGLLGSIRLKARFEELNPPYPDIVQAMKQPFQPQVVTEESEQPSTGPLYPQIEPISSPQNDEELSKQKTLDAIQNTRSFCLKLQNNLWGNLNTINECLATPDLISNRKVVIGLYAEVEHYIRIIDFSSEFNDDLVESITNSNYRNIPHYTDKEKDILFLQTAIDYHRELSQKAVNVLKSMYSLTPLWYKGLNENIVYGVTEDMLNDLKEAEKVELMQKPGQEGFASYERQLYDFLVSIKDALDANPKANIDALANAYFNVLEKFKLHCETLEKSKITDAALIDSIRQKKTFYESKEHLFDIYFFYNSRQ